jgi:RND family efflux transporter MFP subunit
MMRLRVAAAAAGMLLLIACRHDAAEETETQTPVAVAVGVAKTASVREVIAASGLVNAAPGAELLVTAPEAARIVEMPRAEGDRVRAGDLLVRFEIPSLTAGAAAGRAEIEQAEARVENAKAAKERLSGLFDRGVAARKEVEDAERELREANAALAQARSASGAANTLAGRTIVRARFAGVIAKRWHNPGDLVEPGSSDPILRVIDPNRLEIVAAVPVASLGRVTTGAPARVADPAGDSIDATVIARPAAVEAGTVTAPVRLRPLSTTRLTAGTSVRVEILGPEHAGAVVVPPAAVIHEGEESIVVTVDADSKAHRRHVEVGVVTSDAAEIRAGIEAGDRVIVRGHNGLPDGASVTIGS